MKKAKQLWQSNGSKLAIAARIGVATLAVITVAFVWANGTQTQVSASSNVQQIKGVGTKFLDTYTIGSSGIYEYLGNIGIGTAAPQAKLDVLGNVRIEGHGQRSDLSRWIGRS
jgi:hypothetical protein